MAYEVKNHILHKDGKPVAQKPSPNRGGVIKPRILVLHYTATPTAASAINALTNAKAANPVSCHLVLDRDGTVTQLLPFNIKGWHVGVSAWKDAKGKALKNCNDFSIGIEQVNAGVLLKRGDGKIVTQVGTPRVVDPKEAIYAEHRISKGKAWWHIYPNAQVQAAIEIGIAIKKAYGLEDVVGHEDVATPAGRKTDPGPAFPLVSVQSQIMGRQ